VRAGEDQCMFDLIVGGREGLKYAIEEMTETKLVCFNFWRP
jgi:hypothetical protein